MTRFQVKSLSILFAAQLVSFCSMDCPARDVWETAGKHGEQTREVIRFCDRFVWGWLDHADVRSGLIPRNLRKDAFWNAQDAAADNYPFMVLTAEVTGNRHLLSAMQEILSTEQRLTNRVENLPDDFLFATQAFRKESIDMDALIFGASEYAKDGLMPITEWIGPSPWLDRMMGLIESIWAHAEYDTGFGKIPSLSVEVNGELLQTMSRLYWMTGSERMLERVLRLSDYYFLEKDLLAEPRLRLDDHGCEVLGGLSEAYLIVSKKDSQRWEKYRPVFHRILDRVLECGRNAGGLLYADIDPRECKVLNQDLTDNWGYNYNAFLLVSLIDDKPEYREAVQHVLDHIGDFLDFKWENGGADGYADSIEGGINLVNRIPSPGASEWIDESMKILLAKQQPTGIIEGWHGDGNSARTSIMYAFMKTLGTSAHPWRQDLALGAARDEDGSVCVSLACEWPWRGELRFDHPRHREYFNMPYDYPRLNQFPEWFTVGAEERYKMQVGDQEPHEITGKELLAYPMEIDPATPARIRVTPLRN
jgi:hypothetical protein